MIVSLLKIFPFLALTFFAISRNVHAGQITGKIVDSETNLAIEYVAVALYTDTDSVLQNATA